MRGNDKGLGHWVNGVEREKRNKEESHTRECGRKEECQEMGRTRKKRTTPENGVDEDKREYKETGRCSMYF